MVRHVVLLQYHLCFFGIHFDLFSKNKLLLPISVYLTKVTKSEIFVFSYSKYYYAPYVQRLIKLHFGSPVILFENLQLEAVGRCSTVNNSSSLSEELFYTLLHSNY